MFADVAEGTRDAITGVDDRGSMSFETLSRHFTRFAPVSIVPPVLHINSSITDAISSQHLTPSLNITIDHTTKNLGKTNLTLLRFSVYAYCRFLQHNIRYIRIYHFLI